MLPTTEITHDIFINHTHLNSTVLSDLLENIDQGITIVDADLRIVVMNGRAKHILGLPNDFFHSSVTLEDVYRYNAERGKYGPGNIDDQVRRRVELAKKFEAHECEQSRPDGTRIRIKRTLLPNGRFVTVYSDVSTTSKSKREADLTRAILDQLPSPVFCKDENRCYEFCNAAHLEIYGLTWDTAIGTTGAQTIAAEEVKAYRKSDEYVLATGEKFRAEHQIKRQDGTIVEVVTNKTRVETADGKFHIVGAITDITDLKLQEGRLRETREHAESDRQRLVEAIDLLEDGFAATARESALDGTEAAGRAVGAMGGIEESSRQINDIIGLIQEIAFQTNLLSLNASVEAARAGDAGRGFAVVANEVRALAQRAASASNDIIGLITSSDRQVKEGVKLVNEAGQALEDIADTIKKAADQVSQIAAASNNRAVRNQKI